MLYLTPERFRAMGFGTDDIEDSELRAILNRASRAVDRYCAVPLQPQRYSFRGGTITGEIHDYRVGDGVFQGTQRIIYPWHTPLKAVSLCRIYATNTQYVDFAPETIFVSPDKFEIVSLALTSYGLFGAAVTPVLGLGIPKVVLDYSYGHVFTVTDEVLEPTDARTYRALNQFWDDSDVVVKIDGATQGSGYTLDREEGTVIFTANQDADADVTASYGYSMPSEVGEATGIIAVDKISKRAINAGGMTGLRSLKVGEITVERSIPRLTNTAMVSASDVPAEAQDLLDGLRFTTVALA